MATPVTKCFEHPKSNCLCFFGNDSLVSASKKKFGGSSSRLLVTNGTGVYLISLGSSGGKQQQIDFQNKEGRTMQPCVGASTYACRFFKTFAVLADATPEGLVARKEVWSELAATGGGTCWCASYPCMDAFLLRRLQEKTEQAPSSEGRSGEQLYQMYRPAFEMAYNRTKKATSRDVNFHASEDEGDQSADEGIAKKEFRLLMAFVLIYMQALDSFRLVTGQSEEVSSSSSPVLTVESQMTHEEYLGNNEEGAKRVANYGFCALAAYTALFRITFSKMDVSGKGFVTLTEWCEYLVDAEVKNKTTPMGLSVATSTNKKTSPMKGTARKLYGTGGAHVLGENVPAHVVSRMQKTAKAATTTTGVRDIAQSPVTKTSKQLTKPTSNRRTKTDQQSRSTVRTPPPPPRTSSSHSKTMFGKHGPTDDWKLFVATFETLASPPGRNDRLHEWKCLVADSGSGSINRDTLRGWIYARLVNNHKERKGKQLYHFFSPIYDNAFNTAKRLRVGNNDDSDDVTDDVITAKEFRLYNAYLIVYAEMLDAFLSFDGADASEERLIPKTSWLQQHRNVAKYDLVGLARIADPAAVFVNMTNDAKGIELNNWIAYLVKREINGSTEKGTNLAKAFDA